LEKKVIEKLAGLINIEPRIIVQALNNLEYTVFTIPKGKRGRRTIFAPGPILKKVQRKLKNFLDTLESWDDIPVYGITKGTSQVAHARIHKNSKWVFQVDLKNAFESVDILRLKQILLHRLKNKDIEFHEEITELILRLTTYKTILPQGTPTAPILFFFAIQEVLKEIYQIFPLPQKRREKQDKYQYKISCYVDSIVISAQKPIPLHLRKKVFEVIQRYGFKINSRKVKHQGTRFGAVRITGLKVTGERVTISKKQRRKYRAIIHKATQKPEDPELKQKALGIISFLKPIYNGKLPPNLKASKLLEM